MSAGGFQTLTLEYRVFDQCDGVTEAPPFADGEIDERQIYVFEVQRLGVIPLRFFENEVVNPQAPATPSRKVITWAVLIGVPDINVGPMSGLSVGIIDRVGSAGAIAVEAQGQIAAGQEGLYIRRCIKVPQGGVLLVDDIFAPPGGVAVVRLRVWQVEANEEQAMLDNACCCKADLESINLPDLSGNACPDNLLIGSIDPDELALGAVPTTVSIFGTGFSSLQNPTVVFLRFEMGVPIMLPVSDIQVVNDTELTVLVDPNSAGVYTVYVGEEGQIDCFAALQDGFTVTSL